jgi:putative endopeptidase
MVKNHPFYFFSIFRNEVKYFMRLIQWGLLFLLLAGVACSIHEKEQQSSGVGIDLSNMDTTVRPGDNFFQFANGGWIKRNTIPADLGSWGSFTELRERNQQILLDILKNAAEDANYPEGSDQRKAATFFSMGMDSMLAEKVGTLVLRPYLEKIEAIKSKTQIQNYLIEDVLTESSAFFGVFILSDLKNSEKLVPYVTAGGLGLPERDYYIKTDVNSKETREKYLAHVTGLFVLMGTAPAEAKKNAEIVLAIETKLAGAMLTKEAGRDPYNLHHQRHVEQLYQTAPSVDWKSYFEGLSIKADTVIVTEPGFLAEYERIVNSYAMGDIKTYLKATLLRKSAPLLNNAFVKASFEFNSKYLAGVQQMRPRWKRVLSMTNDKLGDAIGQLYVEKTFPPEAKQKALEMVDNIKLAFADRIKELEWMTDSTKEMALKKLSTFTVKMGYPDKWNDYVGLEVNTDPETSSYFQNVMNANRFQTRREFAKLGKPVDRTEWQMTPQTINAYYNPLFNEIVFPAAILQPPFYDYRADEAVNYGGIGAVIGHEISHGFDDQGAKFDSFGNLKNWFKQQDYTNFQRKGKSLASQFDRYEPLPGVFVQGQFTLGENIGDLGGITVAYYGFKRFLRENPGRHPGSINGFTPEQRFFISWATIWRVKYRDEALRTHVLTDPHSPGMYRANGPLSNFLPFYETFGVKEGDKMFRSESERVVIW